jgi:hypothetical protein
MGLKVVDLSVPGWRITEANISALSQQISEIVSKENDAAPVVIFQLFDNNFYYGTDADGNKKPPFKLDGKWHIEGSLQCADRSEVKQLFGSVAGLLRAAGESEKLIVSPLVRYCARPCCLDPGHVTNMGSPDYAKLLSEQLSAVNDWLKDMAFFKRIRNFKVICPNKLLNANKSVEAAAANLAKFWVADPVHMTEAGYSALAGAIYNFVGRGREAGATGTGPGSSTSTGTSTGSHKKK